MISSPEEYFSLFEHDDLDQRKRVLTDEASEAVWRSIVERYPEMTLSVVQNKTIPISILRWLAKDPDKYVRKEVSHKRKLDRALFEELSSDGASIVRQGIAWNNKTPKDILMRLAKDPDEDVRYAALTKLEVPGI